MNTIETEAQRASRHPDHKSLLREELMAQQERSLSLAEAHLADARLSLDKIKHYFRIDNES